MRESFGAVETGCLEDVRLRPRQAAGERGGEGEPELDRRRRPTRCHYAA